MNFAKFPDELTQQLLTRASRAADAGEAVCVLDLPVAIARAEQYLAADAPLAVEGNGGDNTTIIVANRLFDFGVSLEKATELMLSCWNDRCSPAWDDDDLEFKVSSALRSRQDPVGRDNPLRYFEEVQQPPKKSRVEYPSEISIEALLARRSEALVDGLLYPGDIAMLYAFSGDGKSFIALDLAWHLAMGKETWHGRDIDMRVPVLYVALEGVKGFQERVAVTLKEKGDPGAYFGRLLKHDITLRIGNNDSEKQDGVDGMTEIRLAAEEVSERAGKKVGLIVIDTKRQASAGDDENSTEAMMSFVKDRAQKLRDETRAAILIVHHKNKAGTDAGNNSFRQACDLIMVVSRKDEHRAVAIDKNKDGTEGSLFDFKLKQIPLGVDKKGRVQKSAVVTTEFPKLNPQDLLNALEPSIGAGILLTKAVETLLPLFPGMSAKGLHERLDGAFASGPVTIKGKQFRLARRGKNGGTIQPV